ncbi:hypothetical protein OHS58_05935 [Amycolatopsis sp. NBC_00348]|uniref:hypothetical protein n=1 Tax=Amycolatopsis sp. NBC_00348 TaxID=2975956 RepID=UPI002E255844
MSPAARLLLCFPSLAFARKAVRSGLDLRLVVDAGQRALFAPFAADRLTLVDARDETAVAGAVARVVLRCGITHVLDGEGFPATRVCPEFAEAPHVLADDRRLEEVLAPSRHPMVRTRVVATAGAVPGVVAEIGLPAVLRSGDDETVVRSGAALAEWARRHEHRPGPFAAGEFVPGPEVVVTTLTHDGMHRVVGVTAQRAVAHGVRYLFPATVGEAEAREVRATVTAMLDLVGYEFGPAETSVVLSGRGPRIVRARPGFGSRGIARLIEVTTGFDVQTELCRALAGVPVRPPAPRWFAGAEFPRPPSTGVRVLAEGATPEIVEERLDAARRRALTCGDTAVPARYVRNTGAGEVSGIEDGRNREPEL